VERGTRGREEALVTLLWERYRERVCGEERDRERGGGERGTEVREALLLCERKEWHLW
jgi:hypothetical protein